MAKVAVIDDLEALVQMVAAPLRLRGDEVMTMLVPIDFDRLIAFNPQVIVLGLSRAIEANNRPLRDAAQDILGYRSLVEMEQFPAIRIIPVIVIGACFMERDLPLKISYDLFIHWPQDIPLLFAKIDELTSRRKSRRKISSYVCPVCKSRLTYVSKDVDLFCPRCHTAVAIMDDDTCTYQQPGANAAQVCTVADLTPPTPDPSG